MAYTTSDEVRDNLLLIKDTIYGDGDTSLRLPDNYTVDVVSVKKNGADYTGYSFKPPETLELSSTGQTTDYFQVERKILLTDAEINEEIDKAEKIINSIVAKSYKLPFTTVPDTINLFAQDIAKALVIQRLNDHSEYSIHPDELAGAQSAITKAERKLLSICKDRDGELVNPDGSVVKRKNNHKEKTTHVAIDDSAE